MTWKIKWINKCKFAKTALNEDFEIFVIHITALRVTKMTIHPSQVAQIARLQWDKTCTKKNFKYVDFANIFLSNLAIELPKNIGLN